jgi:hypothetical protein
MIHSSRIQIRLYRQEPRNRPQNIAKTNSQALQAADETSSIN